MYNTKKEVDNHVRTALSKLRTESERHLRGFIISKLYFKVNEFATAEQYLLAYLSVKEDNDQAHKLLGQCYQRMEKPAKALQSFQRSLQINPKQQDVLVEVCQLLLDDKNLNSNISKAKYWCELAESEKVQHDAVFSLRLKLMNNDNLQTNQVEELIQKEISGRPKDVHLRVRLVRNYIDQNKVVEAFDYVYKLEMSQNDLFVGNSEWYNMMWLVLSKYEQLSNIPKNWEFWLLVAICLERQVCISFTQAIGGAAMMSSVIESSNLLFNFDQYLFKITQLSDKLKAQKELVTLFVNHYHGQLCLHAASLIFKRELLQNKNKWKETIKTVLPLLLLAYQIEKPDQRQPWMKHCDEQGKFLVQLWNRESAFRCAQAGRTLLACINDKSTNKENGPLNSLVGEENHLWNSNDDLIAQIRQTCSDKQWRRTIFALLFCGNSDHKLKESTSVLVRSGKLTEPLFELPSYADLEECEEIAQYLRPQSLAHMVYLCLANDKLANVRVKLFSGLNFSTQNLAYCSAESLNQLDVDTFLYATTMQAKRLLELNRQTFANYNSDCENAICKPNIMPFAILQNQLCSEEQAVWWLAAYQLYKNLGSDNLLEMRSNLQFGIEAVRGINGPKIDLYIVFMLGKIFVERAEDVLKPVEKGLLEARAESLYKHGLNMLKMHNRGVLEPFRKYFKYDKSNSSAVERKVSAAAEDAVSYLTSHYFKSLEYEELIEELNGIQLPFATYFQAEAYRKLDESNKTPKKSKRKYLDRAAECLKQTLALLKSTQAEPSHPLNAIIHSELKRLQQSTNTYLGNSFDEYPSPSTHGLHNNSSTYEDAQGDVYSPDSPHQLTNTGVVSLTSRSRRETFGGANAAGTVVAPRINSELESLVKQMANTLSFVKEEIVDTIKPELLSMRKEIVELKDKISHLDDAMKRMRLSNPPSRDDASNVLDDFYIIDDTLQNQLYNNNQQQHQQPQHHHHHINQQVTPMTGNMYPPTTCCPMVPQQQSSQQQQQQHQQPRIHTPNALQMPSNNAAAAAVPNANVFGSTMFNPNQYPMNYYASQTQYMLPGGLPAQPQSTPNAASILGQQRNVMQLPYMDGSNAGINFNMPPLAAPTAPLMLPTNTPDNRVPSLFNNNSGNIVQPQQSTNATAQLHLPTNAQMTTTPTNLPGIGGGTFNKTINNQPVEKGPPANVVISSSDPLPNPNSVTVQTQQQTLSVTIPSHHIKHSAVQTPEAANQNNAPFIAPPMASQGFMGGFGGFGGAPTIAPSFASSTFNASQLGGSESGALGGVGGSGSKIENVAAATSTPSFVATASTTSFSFKPQVMQALMQQQQQQQQEQQSNDAATPDAHNDSTLSNEDASGEAEYDPRPDFKPIIPLPDEIVVKTGEENEEEMFCYRAKIFRRADGEWKERGIGNIKILRDQQGHARILMRRDQTHKICANHKITKDLKLTVPKDEAKGFIWAANDFADEELKLETFFVRFKLPETAQQFHDVFKRMQQESEKSMSSSSSSSTVGAINPLAPTPLGLSKSKNVLNFATSTPAAKSDNQPIAATSAPSLSTSTATTATIGAPKTLFSGLSVGKPAAEPSKAGTTTTTTTTSPFANFTFGTTTTNNGVANENVATGGGAKPFANIFSNFNKPSPFTQVTTGTFETPPMNLTATIPAFSTPLGGGTPATSPFATPFATSSFGAAAAAAASTTPKSPFAVETPASAAANKSTASDNEDDYVPTAQFNPVIALPDLVEVNTGEENEIVLFEHRAKLLRYNKETGEWKERGLGNMKLLQDISDVNKVRLVMRREQVHKLCCNQRVYKNTAFAYAKNSTTALTWAGQDFSEENLITELLALRFKTADLCKQFYDAILAAQLKMTINDEGDDKTKKENSSPLAAIASAKNDETPAVKGFGDAFKPKAGSWTCDQCYVSNNGDAQLCCACNAPRDKDAAAAAAKSTGGTTTTTTTGGSTFSFGNVPKFTFGFSNATTTTSSTSTTTATTSSSGPSISSAFTFGIQTSTATAAPSAATTTTNATGTATTTGKSTGVGGFGDQFKPKAGSWTCEACYVSNTATDNYCKACESPKDDTVPKKDTSVAGAGPSVLDLSNPSHKFNFGFAPLGVGGGETTSGSPAGGGFSFGINTTTTKTPTLFGGSDSSKLVSTTTANTTTASDTPKSFSFGLANSNGGTAAPSISKPNFTFTLATSKTTENSTPSAANAFSLDKKDFNFTLKPKSPGKGNRSPQKGSSNGGGDADGNMDDLDADNGDEEEEENNTYFTPVIPLPDKIDVKTGEENEDLLYTHRAKLYRFTDGEWKERGVGDVKILRHCESGKLRVVMRRDQVLKICLNHVLNSDVEYKHKDDKSWLFVVNDFSEGTVEFEKFSLRFKNHEIAEGFMKAVRAALDGTADVIRSNDTPTTSHLPSSSNTNNAIKLTDEIPSSPTTLQPAAEQKLIDVLKLPADFFAPKPACAGCRGCNPDEFVFMDVEPARFIDATFKPLEPLELPLLTMPKSNRSSSFLKQSVLNVASAGDSSTAGDASKMSFSFTTAFSSTAKNSGDSTLFGSSGGPLFGSSGGTLFGSAFNANRNENDGAKSIFGGSGFTANTQTGSIFGGKPTFGALPNANEPKIDTTKLIFGNTGSVTKPEIGNSFFGAKTTFGSGGGAVADAGSGGFGTTTTTSIFGGTATTNTTNNNSNATSIFGGNASLSFASLANKSDAVDFSTLAAATNQQNANNSPSVPEEKSLTTSPDKNVSSELNASADNNNADNNTFANLLNKTDILDFAALAAQTKNNPIKPTEQPGPGGFFGLTKQDAFSSFSKSSNNNSMTGAKNANNDESNNFEDSTNDDNYDPHYEPIIPLPNQIVVSTGEENETKLFGERATLFRWDDTNKEWKERGVGEMKILLHPELQTYRLILRREQIHKLVLNESVSAGFTFTNMNNSPKSFVWAGMNYAESNEGTLEKLAVRFKKIEIAEEFSKTLNECIDKAKKHDTEETQN